MFEVNGKPVLVDFENSVIDRELVQQTSGASIVPRSSATGVRRWLTSMLLGSNRVAPGNIRRFIDLLTKHNERPRILIVGGGTIGSGIDSLYEEANLELVSFDVYSSEQVQFIADAHSIPLLEGSVDGVVVQAVLEHVVSPTDVVAEIVRVLRPGGIVYAETPFLQHVHEGAFDFTRFTESGHRYLFRDFAEIGSGVVLGPGTVVAWSLESLASGLFRSRLAGLIVRAVFFWLRYFDRLISPSYAADGASGVYFLGSLDGTRISPKDLVQRYCRAHAQPPIQFDPSAARVVEDRPKVLHSMRNSLPPRDSTPDISQRWEAAKLP